MTGTWLAMAVGGWTGVVPPTSVLAALGVLRWLAPPTAALAAGYAGFLFNRADGRDLWQSAMLTPHLMVRAALAGSGAC